MVIDSIAFDESGASDKSESGEWCISDYLYWLLGILIIVCGGLLRFHALDSVPLHHDEGINGSFLIGLFRSGYYVYQPENYHGPTLYYFALVSSYLFGLNSFAIRLVTIIFGLGIILVLLLMRRELGSMASISTALMICVSPGAVYFSRYFIHETLLVFFSLAVAVAAVKYLRTTRRVLLLAGAASLALMVTTKETAVISIFTLVFAVIVTDLFVTLRTHPEAPLQRSKIFGYVQGFNRLHVPQVIAALSLFTLIYTLFYTSFLTHPWGLVDSFRTYFFWAQTATGEHPHSWSAYFEWLYKEETALLALGALGLLFAIAKPISRFTLCIGLWGFTTIAIYSLITYKTPWITLNFIPPLAITGGFLIQSIYNSFSGSPVGSFILKSIAMVLLATSIGFSLKREIALNYRGYDDDSYSYVYAHTQRGLLSLVEMIDDQRKASGKEAVDYTIDVMSPDYWPLPWYLKDYVKLDYPGYVKEKTSADMVICNYLQKGVCEPRFSNDYHIVAEYPLRPGVLLSVYVRNK